MGRLEGKVVIVTGALGGIGRADAAMQGVPFAAAYCASKGGVRSLTKSVAVHCREKKNGVRCNSVHPDGVKTPMVVKVATGKEDASRAEIMVDNAALAMGPAGA